MSGLISKVLAGGLSAGVFLVWWPAHITATGSEWLFVRGILWSLAFEILLLAYSPLEKAVAGAVRAREPRSLGTRRVARVLTFAALAIVVPLVMLAGSRPRAGAPARAAAPKVIVKREIVKREVVVRRVSRVVRVPGPTVTTSAPAAPAAAPARTATATRAAPPKTPSSKPAAKTTATSGAKGDTKADAAAPAATAPAPAATTTAAQPTTAARTPAAATTATPAAAEASSVAGR